MCHPVRTILLRHLLRSVWRVQHVLLLPVQHSGHRLHHHGRPLPLTFSFSFSFSFSNYRVIQTNHKPRTSRNIVVFQMLLLLSRTLTWVTRLYNKCCWDDKLIVTLYLLLNFQKLSFWVQYVPCSVLLARLLWLEEECKEISVSALQCISERSILLRLWGRLKTWAGNNSKIISFNSFLTVKTKLP